VISLSMGMVMFVLVTMMAYAMTLSARYQWGPVWLQHAERAEQMRGYAAMAGSLVLVLWQGVEWFLTVFTTVVVLVAVFDWSVQRYLVNQPRQSMDEAPEWVVFCRQYAVMLLAIFVVRFFVVQHYRVPTGSLEPTLKPGDFVLVNQFSYGWHLPISDQKLIGWGEPRRGDVAVFRYPPNPQVMYVKRVIGLPGDHIIYRNKSLTVNGKHVDSDYIGLDQESGPVGVANTVIRRHEKLAEKPHDIFIQAGFAPSDYVNVVVPQGHYFVMGDNRDHSHDSRMWGPLPESHLVGRAVMVLFSIDPYQWWLDWRRSGLWL